MGGGAIQIMPQMRIHVVIEAVDGRKGIDSPARLCQEKLQTDPFSGGGSAVLWRALAQSSQTPRRAR